MQRDAYGPLRNYAVEVEEVQAASNPGLFECCDCSWTGFNGTEKIAFIANCGVLLIGLAAIAFSVIYVLGLAG